MLDPDDLERAFALLGIQPSDDSDEDTVETLESQIKLITENLQRFGIGVDADDTKSMDAPYSTDSTTVADGMRAINMSAESGARAAESGARAAERDARAAESGARAAERDGVSAPVVHSCLLYTSPSPRDRG